MPDAQSQPETIEDRLSRWFRIAEGHSSETEAYKLYPGDWASLAGVLRDALRAFDQAQDGEIVRDDNYHAGELAERACWIVRRRDGELVHEEALKRIEMLMDAEGDTPAGQELDLLTTLVQFYERKPESEVMPHSVETCDAGFPITDWACKKCPHCGATMDEACKGRTPAATAPVTGADPPWLDECRDFAWSHTGKKPHATDPEIARAQNAIIRRVLAFATAQPPSEAEVKLVSDSLFGYCIPPIEIYAALIAAAKARSGD